MQLLAAPIDRASLPDDVEALKDVVLEMAQAFHALRAQANQQMASLAAQLSEFKRRVFGGRSEMLVVLQPELWQDKVEIPVPPEQLDEVKGHKVVEQFHTEHAERYLLAFVYGWLDEHDLMGVRTEAEKYLMLGALNLVECVAFVGAVKPRQ